MAKIACKNGGTEGNNEANGIHNAQTEKYSSTTLKRDQKYEHLQLMTTLKTVCRYARQSMQNMSQKRAIKKGIPSIHQTSKDP